MRSQRALRAALGFEETRERGVKKRWNFRGVMDGLRRSLRGRGGDDGMMLAAVFAELLGVRFSVWFAELSSITISGWDDINWGWVSFMLSATRPGTKRRRGKRKKGQKSKTDERILYELVTNDGEPTIPNAILLNQKQSIMFRGENGVEKWVWVV